MKNVWGLIFWLAGELAIEPWSFTLRELFIMSSGHSFAEWTRSSSLEATVANTARDEKKRRRPYTFRDFHPVYLWEAKKKRDAAKQKQRNDGSGMKEAKTVFVGSGGLDLSGQEGHGLGM